MSAREAHHKTYPDSAKQEDVCYGVAMAQYDTFYVVGGDSAQCPHFMWVSGTMAQPETMVSVG